MNFSGMIPKIFRPGPPKGLRGKEALRHIAHLEHAFPHICDMITAHVDLDKVLWEIPKEVLYCVEAHRATIFIMDTAAEALTRGQTFVYSPEHHRQRAYRKEEEEIVSQSFDQEKPFLLDVEDFPELFPGHNPNWELTSMMTFPFASRKKPVGVLSAVLFNGRHGFDEGRFRLFSGFAKLTSLAVEMADLLREIEREAVWKREFEKYLNEVLIRLQGFGSNSNPG